jgi:hypothetical protein
MKTNFDFHEDKCKTKFRFGTRIPEVSLTLSETEVILTEPALQKSDIYKTS